MKIGEMSRKIKIYKEEKSQLIDAVRMIKLSNFFQEIAEEFILREIKCRIKLLEEFILEELEIEVRSFIDDMYQYRESDRTYRIPWLDFKEKEHWISSKLVYHFFPEDIGREHSFELFEDKVLIDVAPSGDWPVKRHFGFELWVENLGYGIDDNDLFDEKWLQIHLDEMVIDFHDLDVKSMCYVCKDLVEIHTWIPGIGNFCIGCCSTLNQFKHKYRGPGIYCANNEEHPESKSEGK